MIVFVRTTTLFSSKIVRVIANWLLVNDDFYLRQIIFLSVSISSKYNRFIIRIENGSDTRRLHLVKNLTAVLQLILSVTEWLVSVDKFS